MEELKVDQEKGSTITKLSRSKIVIEVDNANEHVIFWETKYTFRQIVELVCTIPDLLAQVNSYFRENKTEDSNM